MKWTMQIDRFGPPAFLLAAWFVLHATAPAQGRVWRVAPSGGDFTEIRDAVAAAQSGDVILVATAPTSYREFSVTGKALTIMSADAGKPLVLGMTNIANLPAGQMCRIVNMKFKGRDFNPGPGHPYTLILEQFTQTPTIPPVTFVLSGCEVEAGRGYWWPQLERPGAPTAALLVGGGGTLEPKDHLFVLDHVRAIGFDQAVGLLAGDSTVIANKCFFQGGEGMLVANLFSTWRSHGGHGAWVGDGNIYLAECDLRGGSVAPQVYGFVQNGGNGLSLGRSARGSVFARGTTMVGGNGGDVGLGSRGGYGLQMEFTSSQAYVDGQPFIGGWTLAGNVIQEPAVFGTPPPITRKLGALSFDRALADLGTSMTLGLVVRPREPHVLLASALPRLPVPGVLEPLPIVGTPFWFPLVALTADGTGRATLPLPIPMDQTLRYQTLFVQGVGLALDDHQLVVDSISAMTMR